MDVALDELELELLELDDDELELDDALLVVELTGAGQLISSRVGQVPSLLPKSNAA